MIITQAFKEAFFANLIGTTTPILDNNYIAFISYYKQILNTNNLFNFPNELDRIQLTSSNKSYLNSAFTYDFTIPVSRCVCSTTTISSKDSTSSILTVASSSNFEVNNLIEVETINGFIERNILAISGNNITIDTPTNVIISGILRKKVSHLVILVNASNIVNKTSDQIFATFESKFFRDGTASLQIKRKFDYK